MARHPAADLALVLAAILGLFALIGAAAVVPRFFDPCHEWGTGSEGGRDSAQLDDECPSRSGSSQTRAEAALNLVAIQGVLLLAAGAIVRGALRPARVWTAAGATMVAVLVPPFGLGIFWVFILLIAAGLFTAAAQLPAPVRPVGALERSLAYSVAALGVGFVAAFLTTAGGSTLALIAVGVGAAGMSLTALIDRKPRRT